jgi:hypothetical protein
MLPCGTISPQMVERRGVRVNRVVSPTTANDPYLNENSARARVECVQK